MKPSGGEERLGPGQDDLDMLGLGMGANVSPQIAQCLQEGKLQSEHTYALYKEKGYHHHVPGGAPVVR